MPDNLARLRRATSVGSPLLFAWATAVCPSNAAWAEPFSSDRYELDLFQGPVLAPIRVVSLGGSYAGLAEGTAGLVSSAASASVRDTFAIRPIEFGMTGSFSFPIDAFENNDFDNSGEPDDDASDFIYGTAGAVLKIGHFGVGASAELFRYEIDGLSSYDAAVTLGKFHVLGGYGFADNQVNMGGGLRALVFDLASNRGDSVYAGAAPELGFLIRPTLVPIRIGATYRFAVGAKPMSDDFPLRSTLMPPRSVVLPWELETGLAVQIGPRPLNVEWRDPETSDEELEERVRRTREARRRLLEEQLRETPSEGEWLRAQEEDFVTLEERALKREDDWQVGRVDDAVADLPHQRLLVTLSLLVSGPTDLGVAMEPFLTQSRTRDSDAAVGASGGAVNFSPRFGVEAEAVSNLLFLRSGTYYEPSRIGGIGRQHFTFGAQMRAFSTSFWGIAPEWPYGLEFGVDLAPRYESISATVSLFR